MNVGQCACKDPKPVTRPSGDTVCWTCGWHIGPPKRGWAGAGGELRLEWM